MSHSMFQVKHSIFKVLIVATLVAATISILALSYFFYRNMIAPIQEKVFAESATLMHQELKSLLQAKEDSVVSVAVGLARDQRVIDGLANSNREPLISAIKDIGDDYARTTQYKKMRAQVIDREQTIVARSWDVNFQGQKAPHPLGKKVSETQRAEASFGVGNAGVGVVGFAPVFSNQQFVGLVSITQAIDTVVRNLKAKDVDWVMLTHRPALVARTDGQLLEAYQKLPLVGEDTLLAHPTLFSPEAVEYVKKHLIPLQESLNNTQFVADGKFVSVQWVYDEAGFLVGDHILIQDAQPVLDKVAEAERHIILISSAELLMIVFLVALLLWLVRRLIVRPLVEVSEAVTQVIQSGDFSRFFPVHGSNELEQMKAQLNVLLSHTSFAIHEANAAVSAAANIDFERKMQGTFVGDLRKLQLGINNAITDLHQTHELLTHATQAKGQFLANMSHEIRTPINGIVGMLTLLQGTQLSTEQMEHLRLAQSSSELLLGVVNDILDFSKIEAGKMTIEQIPYNLKDVLANTRSVFAQALQPKGLTLVYDKADDISEYVIGDALRLRQVITNLLSNAMKFTEKGSVTLSVRICEGYLHFAVQDTGIGMTEEVRAKLFQSFSQADASTSRKFGGTGLGLTISKELVHLMGGEIGVNSTLGQGSCFWFTLPYKPAVAPQEKPSTHTLVSFNDKHILLVEDNIVNQKVATKLLERFGIRVTVADNGQKAVDMLSDISVDLVFMDCQMPIMDGYTATRVLRQQDFKTPIVAMTANASAQDRAECIACGMNDFIAKPYQLNELTTILQRWLG